MSRGFNIDLIWSRNSFKIANDCKSEPKMSISLYVKNVHFILPEWIFLSEILWYLLIRKSTISLVDEIKYFADTIKSNNKIGGLLLDSRCKLCMHSNLLIKSFKLTKMANCLLKKYYSSTLCVDRGAILWNLFGNNKEIQLKTHRLTFFWLLSK